MSSTPFRKIRILFPKGKLLSSNVLDRERLRKTLIVETYLIALHECFPMWEL